MDGAWPRNWPTQAKELHIFDPKGDVLLLLNRCIPEEESEAAAEEPIAEDPPPEVCIVEDLPLEETASEAIESDQESKPVIQQVQMRVSSKHLILASRTFCTSLNSFYAGHMLETEGNVILPFPDEDPDVMIILLHIIHGQNRKVPRRVSLDMLTKLAAAVNYHHLQEAAELFADIWINDLIRKKCLTTYTSKTLRWLFIFWVFRFKENFRKITQILQQECDDNLKDEANAVPEIPASIISTIQMKRIAGINRLIQAIHDLITKYSGTDILCANDQSACDALILGTIIKRSVSIGIWPKPTYPYPGLTYKALAKKIEEIQIPETWENDHGCASYDSENGDLHGIEQIIKASIKSLEYSMYGLELEDFLPTQDKERLSKDWLTS